MHACVSVRMVSPDALVHIVGQRSAICWNLNSESGFWILESSGILRILTAAQCGVKEQD